MSRTRNTVDSVPVNCNEFCEGTRLGGGPTLSGGDSKQ